MMDEPVLLAPSPHNAFAFASGFLLGDASTVTHVGWSDVGCGVF